MRYTVQKRGYVVQIQLGPSCGNKCIYYTRNGGERAFHFKEYLAEVFDTEEAAEAVILNKDEEKVVPITINYMIG